MADALTDRRSGPTEYTAPPPSPATKEARQLAAVLEGVARELREGKRAVGFDGVVLVFHSSTDRAVEVLPVGPTRTPIASDNATLAALSRALTRWSLPIE